MKKLIIVALIICFLCAFGINSVYADVGWFGNTGHSSGGLTTENNYYCSPFSLDEDANVTDIHVYGQPWSVTSEVKPFIYSLDGETCYWHGDPYGWNAEQWYNWTNLNTSLAAGMYLLGFRAEVTDMVHYWVAGNGMTGTVDFGAAWGTLSPTYNSRVYAVYCNYTVLPEDTILVEEPINLWYQNATTFNSTMTETIRFGILGGENNYIYTFGLLAILIICLALFKFGFPLLNVVFAIVSLGLVAATIGNAYVLFSPYLQLGVALVSVILMISSAQKGIRT